MNRGDTQYILLDTPGLHKARSRLGDYMVKVVRESLAQVEAGRLGAQAAGRATTNHSTAGARGVVLGRIGEDMNWGGPATARIDPEAERALQETAIKQNINTLNKRVNELGVAEPIIQQQGADRIVVQLPGVQDVSRAKDIIGRTATLEVRMVDESVQRGTEETGAVPFGSELFKPDYSLREIEHRAQQIVAAVARGAA